MNINHRHYVLLTVAFIVLLISAASYLLLYRSVVSQARQSSQILAEVTLESNKKLHERELTATYADTLSDRTRISGFVVSEEKIVPFIESVEKIGTDSGTDLEISAIGTEKAAAQDTTGFGHIAAHLDIKGSWSNVMRALLLVENMPYSVTVNNVRLVASSEVVDSVPVKKGDKPQRVRQWGLSLDIRVLTSK